LLELIFFSKSKDSKDPVFRYIIGNDATNCIRMRKSLSDKEFMKWIRDGIFHSKGFTR